MAECSRGWAGRCARSKTPRCRCRCGGENHGVKPKRKEQGEMFGRAEMDRLDDEAEKRYPQMLNRAMARKLTSGECIDLADLGERQEDGTWILRDMLDGKDYCDASREKWVHSIGRNAAGEIRAAHDTRYYMAEDQGWECLWLR